MGLPMICHTTPKNEVGQGGATTHKNMCPTTPTPYGGWGGGGAATHVHGEVGQFKLVPMPGFSGWGGFGGRGYAFALCAVWLGWLA